MDVLLTFTGFHDPFSDTAMEGDRQTGPVLTVVAERHFDRVYLFVTPKLAERSSETKTEIEERYPMVEVDMVEVPLADPTNYIGILRQLRKHFRTLNAKHPAARYSISVSSGTPHMHASWILLAASGEIPARILQSNPPQFVPEGKSPVREIDVTHKDFPHITAPVGPGRDRDGDEAQAIIDACREVGIIGEDPAFLKALRQAHVYAQYDDTNVLLLGETGSGKEYFERFIPAVVNLVFAKPVKSAAPWSWTGFGKLRLPPSTAPGSTACSLTRDKSMSCLRSSKNSANLPCEVVVPPDKNTFPKRFHVHPHPGAPFSLPPLRRPESRTVHRVGRTKRERQDHLSGCHRLPGRSDAPWGEDSRNRPGAER